ncbi:MAG: hypothetical protein ACO1QB_17300 [Verrucomicrobiales bacterium]
MKRKGWKEIEDHPAFIAKWLFRLGIFWAVYCALLVPLAVAALFQAEPNVRLFIYLLFGYTVWLGWRWRSLKRRAYKTSIILWVGSAGFNAFWIIWLMVEEGQWFGVFVLDEMSFIIWWWVAVMAASVFALISEVKLQRKVKST